MQFLSTVFAFQELTVHLFADTRESPHAVGTDLVALNIQRGRDHGLPGGCYTNCHIHTQLGLTYSGQIPGPALT